MNSYPRWEKLVARLEADLQARETSQNPSTLDDDAWKTTAKLLRSRARILIVTHAGLQPQDVADLVQNVFVKLQSTKTMRRLRAARSPEGYIFVMLRNAANDLVRRRQLEKALFSPIGMDGLAGEPSSEPEYVLQTEKASILAKALGSLTEEEKGLLRMRFWRDMSIGEIADETATSYSATAVKLFRILHRLRDRMTQE